MDIDNAIEVLNKNSSYLEKNDFEGLFKNIDEDSRADVYEFLINELSIDPLPTMRTIYRFMFAGVPGGKLILPDNITKLDRGAFAGARFDVIKLSDNITSIPTACFANTKFSRLFIPKACKRIDKEVFDADLDDDAIIVTPWRDSVTDKLNIPANAVDFYKKHLRFQHKPVNEPTLDGTNQGEGV